MFEPQRKGQGQGEQCPWKALIEAGFEYVCTTPNGTMLFRKRK